MEGWKKNHFDKDFVSYEKGNKLLRIWKTRKVIKGVWNGKYFYDLAVTYGGGLPEVNKQFNSRQSALAFAKKYMREN